MTLLKHFLERGSVLHVLEMLLEGEPLEKARMPFWSVGDAVG